MFYHYFMIHFETFKLKFDPQLLFCCVTFKKFFNPCDLSFFIYKLGTTIFTLDGHLPHRSVCLGVNLHNKNIIKKD